MFLIISRCRKSLVMSTPKLDNFMQLFLTFVGHEIYSVCFVFCSIAGEKLKMTEISMKT